MIGRAANAGPGAKVPGRLASGLQQAAAEDGEGGGEQGEAVDERSLGDQPEAILSSSGHRGAGSGADAYPRRNSP